MLITAQQSKLVGTYLCDMMKMILKEHLHLQKSETNWKPSCQLLPELDRHIFTVQITIATIVNNLRMTPDKNAA